MPIQVKCINAECANRIGTPASLQTLERLAATDPHLVVKSTASAAIRAIQECNP